LRGFAWFLRNFALPLQKFPSRLRLLRHFCAVYVHFSDFTSPLSSSFRQLFNL
jgi:hypothetical protein